MVISCTPLATGACCIRGNCSGGVTAANCQSQGGTYQGDNSSCGTVSCAPPCPADITGDSVVNIDDLLAVINNWGSLGGVADINHDNIVNIDDLLAVINAWGACP